MLCGYKEGTQNSDYRRVSGRALLYQPLPPKQMRLPSYMGKEKVVSYGSRVSRL